MSADTAPYQPAVDMTPAETGEPDLADVDAVLDNDDDTSLHDDLAEIGGAAGFDVYFNDNAALISNMDDPGYHVFGRPDDTTLRDDEYVLNIAFQPLPDGVGGMQTVSHIAYPDGSYRPGSTIVLDPQRFDGYNVTDDDVLDAAVDDDRFDDRTGLDGMNAMYHELLHAMQDRAATEELDGYDPELEYSADRDAALLYLNEATAAFHANEAPDEEGGIYPDGQRFAATLLGKLDDEYDIVTADGDGGYEVDIDAVDADDVAATLDEIAEEYHVALAYLEDDAGNEIYQPVLADADAYEDIADAVEETVAEYAGVTLQEFDAVDFDDGRYAIDDYAAQFMNLQEQRDALYGDVAGDLLPDGQSTAIDREYHPVDDAAA
jgi:hypothetical protein